MAAREESVHSGPGEIVEEMAQYIEICAEQGEWDRVEEIAVRLRNSVMLVPEQHRRESVQRVQHCIERVQALAATAKDEVATRLATIRRGQHATRAYGKADM
ncbi:MAG: flagellar protein FliT [Pseudomonadota bacterium]